MGGVRGSTIAPPTQGALLHKRLVTKHEIIKDTPQGELMSVGSKLGQALLNNAYAISYIPGTSFQGVLDDLRIFDGVAMPEHREASYDKSDIVQFVGGVIAESGFRLPLEDDKRHEELALICLGVAEVMIEPEAE